MQTIDSLISAKWIIPIQPAGQLLSNHSLAIIKDKIIAILPTKQAQQQYQAKQVIELNNHALIPGFVNAHCHAAMTLLRGYADDLPLMDWLQNYIWPAEAQWVSSEMIADGTELAIAEMLSGGVTCSHDMYFFPEIAAQQFIKAGMRAHLGIPCIEGISNAWGKDIDECISKGIKIIEQFKGHDLIGIHFAPHAPYTVSDNYLIKLRDLAKQYNTHLQIHLHETAFEVEQALTNDKKRPMQRLFDLGILSPETVAIHLTQLTDQDIQQLADSGTHAVTCPESNLKLASGFCPVQKLLNAGVNVAIGTDGAASNNDLDMLTETRTTALLAKAVANDATAVSAETALRMATLNGAKALGLDNKIGSLEVGKQADITAIEFNEFANHPLYNPISQIVYTATRQQVSDVWVAGKQLLSNKQLTTLDKKAILTKANQWREKINDNTQVAV